jgi:Zn-dependent peptidase ImmA (M78 family)
MKTLPLETIENLATQFRLKNELSLSEPINIKSLLRKLEIFTIYKPLSISFYGMSLQSKSGDKFILINSNQPKGRQHFTIAHEFYHLYFDENPVPHICDATTSEKSPVEKDANAFASAFLMPYDGLMKNIPKEELKNKMSLATIIRIEQYFSVSRKALLVRLKSKSFISKTEYNDLERIPVQESAKQYGYDISLYNKGNEGLVISNFGEKARILYDKGKISEGHYLELLNKIAPNE